jgi:hypothetical protein
MKMISPAPVPQNERINGSLWVTADPAIEALWASFVEADMAAPGAYPTAKDGFYYAHRQLADIRSALESAEAKIAAHNEKHTMTYRSTSDEAWKRNPCCSCGEGIFPCGDAIDLNAEVV